MEKIVDAMEIKHYTNKTVILKKGKKLTNMIIVLDG